MEVPWIFQRCWLLAPADLSCEDPPKLPCNSPSRHLKKARKNRWVIKSAIGNPSTVNPKPRSLKKRWWHFGWSDDPIGWDAPHGAIWRSSSWIPWALPGWASAATGYGWGSSSSCPWAPNGSNVVPHCRFWHKNSRTSDSVPTMHEKTPNCCRETSDWHLWNTFFGLTDAISDSLGREVMQLWRDFEALEVPLRNWKWRWNGGRNLGSYPRNIQNWLMS